VGLRKGERVTDRAVVLCRTSSGLRAASWLARQGVAVRLLCTTRFPVDSGPVVVAGVRSDVEEWLGPCADVRPKLEVWHGGRAHALPTRKRDVLAMVGGTGPLAMLSYAAGRAAPQGPTAEDWVTSWFGRPVWDRAVHGWLDHRLAGPGARSPAGVVRRLLGRGTHGGWWLPTNDGEERLAHAVASIHESSGEALEDVGVEGLEVENGRVVGVRTEFGLDHVDGPLYTDFTPAELSPLLGDGALLAPKTPMADRVLVEVRGSLVPWAMLVLEPARGLVALSRSCAGSGGSPLPDRVVAEAIVGHVDPLFGADDATLGRAIRERLVGLLDGLGDVVRVVREPARVACPRPSAEAPWEALVHRYQSLGIQPLGETGFLLPMSRMDELGVLRGAQQGAVIQTQRESLLQQGAPEEPWSLLAEA
jgi:hypothetical protein